jgi:anti-sigma factor RsiW
LSLPSSFRQATREALQYALERLSPRYREAVLLCGCGRDEVQRYRRGTGDSDWNCHVENCACPQVIAGIPRRGAARIVGFGRKSELMTNCTEWQNQIDAYVDTELPPLDTDRFRTHAEGCAACAAMAVAAIESKSVIRRAGHYYTASPELRTRVFALVNNRRLTNDQDVSARRKRGMSWGAWPRLTSATWPRWTLAAAALLLVAVGFFMVNQRQQSTALAELVDLHVADLASANPVEVVSADRHTVKPWFQGKIPFTFDLPELQGSAFALLGGRLAYFHQEPGAELLFSYQRHFISVFIFRQTPQLALPASFADQSSSFRVRTWTQSGLRYVVVGDANAAIIQQLSDLLRDVQ